MLFVDVCISSIGEKVDVVGLSLIAPPTPIVFVCIPSSQLDSSLLHGAYKNVVCKLNKLNLKIVIYIEIQNFLLFYIKFSSLTYPIYHIEYEKE